MITGPVYGLLPLSPWPIPFIPQTFSKLLLPSRAVCSMLGIQRPVSPWAFRSPAGPVREQSSRTTALGRGVYAGGRRGEQGELAFLGGGAGESPVGRMQWGGDWEKLGQRNRVREVISGNQGRGVAGHTVEERGRGQTMRVLLTRLGHPGVWTSCWRN